MMCQDQVLLLPPNSQWLAQSDQCPHGIFLVGNTMLGIQAHPEFSKSHNQAIIEARIGKIGTEKAKLGMQSLQKSSFQTLRLPIHLPSAPATQSRHRHHPRSRRPETLAHRRKRLAH